MQDLFACAEPSHEPGREDFDCGQVTASQIILEGWGYNRNPNNPRHIKIDYNRFLQLLQEIDELKRKVEELDGRPGCSHE